jgi:hypothetical protein
VEALELEEVNRHNRHIVEMSLNVVAVSLSVVPIATLPSTSRCPVLAV